MRVFVVTTLLLIASNIFMTLAWYGHLRWLDHRAWFFPSTEITGDVVVCDGSVVGADSIVRAGSVVKQRSQFGDGRELDGFPAVDVGAIAPPARPAWAFDPNELPRGR